MPQARLAADGFALPRRTGLSRVVAQVALLLILGSLGNLALIVGPLVLVQVLAWLALGFAAAVGLLVIALVWLAARLDPLRSDRCDERLAS